MNTVPKAILSFSKRSEKIVFPKKVALENDLSCIMKKGGTCFSRKYDFIL